jgi:hypothetical protein|tara:strand:+ start:848 stop:1198 length:351 start_codon:yes stop_codon:yes gene_type:complete
MIVPNQQILTQHHLLKQHQHQQILNLTIHQLQPQTQTHHSNQETRVPNPEVELLEVELLEVEPVVLEEVLGAPEVLVEVGMAYLRVELDLVVEEGGHGIDGVQEEVPEDRVVDIHG